MSYRGVLAELAAGCDMILAEMKGDSDFTPCVIRAVPANEMTA